MWFGKWIKNILLLDISPEYSESVSAVQFIWKYNCNLIQGNKKQYSVNNIVFLKSQILTILIFTESILGLENQFSKS